MALLYIDGFEQYTIADEETMSRNGWNSAAAGGLGNAAIHIQAQTRHAGFGHQLQLTANNVAVARGVPATVDFIFGFAYKPDGIGGFIIAKMLSGGTVAITLQLTAGGDIEIRRGSSAVIGVTSGLNLVAQTWYYIEFECLINDSGNYDLHVDGASVKSDPSVDTKSATTTLHTDGIQFIGNSTHDATYDDIYFLDKTGSDNIDFLGDCRVETVFPDADGNENDWTRVGGGSNNFEAVDDGATVDDDSTYNHSATATERELYGFAPLTGNIDTVFGVQASMIVRKEEAGFREVRVISRNNVTEVESVNKTLGIKYQQKNMILENNPDGGGDWTEAAVNTAQFGIDLQT